MNWAWKIEIDQYGSFRCVWNVAIEVVLSILHHSHHGEHPSECTEVAMIVRYTSDWMDLER